MRLKGKEGNRRGGERGERERKAAKDAKKEPQE